MSGRREKGLDRHAAHIAVAAAGIVPTIGCNFMGHTTKLGGPAPAGAGLTCSSHDRMAHPGIQVWQRRGESGTPTPTCWPSRTPIGHGEGRVEKSP